jgi:beta-lactamase superfamily II metal-dependent hydrolase
LKTAIHILNVDHGDSLIIEIIHNQENFWIVIDCHNPDKNQDSPTLAYLKSKKVEKLEFICLSHPDRDHHSGMHQLLKYYSEDGRSVGSFYVTTTDETIYRSLITSEWIDKELKLLYLLIRRLSIEGKLIFDGLGDNKTLFELDAIKIYSISPLDSHYFHYMDEVRQRKIKKDNGENPGSVNKNYLSSILFLETSTSSTLFCSDATSSMISSSLAKFSGKRKKLGTNTYIKNIKVSHHGSKENHCEELWSNYTIPYVTNAGISAGGSRFSMLPQKDVVDCILKNKINLYCTNLSGCLSPSSKSLIPKSGFSKSISKPPVLHGNISFIDDSGILRTETQFPVPPIK